MKTGMGINLTSVVGVAAILFAAACGTASDSGKTPDAAAAGSGSGGSGSGTGGSATAGDSGPGTAGSTGTGVAGTGGSGGSGGDPIGMACEPKASFALAIHIIIDMSWEGTLGANMGSGKVHLWNLAQITANGTALTGTIQPCGSALPELTLKPLVGGGKVLVEVPQTVWDMPSAPKFPVAGTLSSWSTGSMLMTTPTIALVGLTMPDQEAAWPTSYTMITTTDVDGDGAPGITGIPKTGTGYVQTPVSLPIAGFGSKADKLFLVSRTGVGLNGTMTSCTEQSGTVLVKFFDNHVVGCHVNGGADCTAAQIDFVDSNRTKYTVTGATFTSKIVADTTTCVDARAL